MSKNFQDFGACHIFKCDICRKFLSDPTLKPNLKLKPNPNLKLKPNPNRYPNVMDNEYNVLNMEQIEIFTLYGIIDDTNLTRHKYCIVNKHVSEQINEPEKDSTLKQFESISL